MKVSQGSKGGEVVVSPEELLGGEESYETRLIKGGG